MTYETARDRVNRGFDGVFRWGLGHVQGAVLETGQLTNFGVRALAKFFQPPFRFTELISHMEFVGNKSVMIICLSGTFTGMALAFQVYLGFKKVNVGSLVGPTVALSVFRELGPVLTGLIVSARAGGAMTARLGTMRVTEQIDALEVMGVDPMQYLVSPRVYAAVLVMPLLTGIFDFVSMFGCWLISIKLLEMDEAQFWDRIAAWVEPYHIYEGLFKAAVFGLFFAIICTQRGFTTKGGASGVGTSTNRGVVTSMVMIIVLDFFVTNLINLFYAWKDAIHR